MARAFIRMRLVILALVAAGSFGNAAAQTPDPLPSWNDGPVKKSITDFVPRVTTVGSPDFVPRDQRLHAIHREHDLEIHGLLGPQRAVVVEGGNALIA